LGHRLLLVDGDLALANASMVLGQMPQRGIEDVLEGTCSLQEAAATVDNGLTVLSAGGDRMRFASQPAKHVGRLLHHFRNWSCDADLLMLDTASGAAEDVMCWALAADDLVLVTTPEPTALTDAYILTKVLLESGFAGRIGVVVNMAGSLESRRIFDSFQHMLYSSCEVDPVLLGNIPQDPEASRAVRMSTPVLQLNPNSPASRAIRETAQSLINWSSPGGQPSLTHAVGAWARRLMRWQVQT
jgi:flagellar biosynthesis protein FlhG